MPKAVHKTHRKSEEWSAFAGQFTRHRREIAEKFIFADKLVAVKSSEKKERVVGNNCADKRAQKNQRQIQIALLDGQPADNQKSRNVRYSMPQQDQLAGLGERLEAVFEKSAIKQNRGMKHVHREKITQ